MLDLRLSQKNALVFGGSAGIGLGIAKALATQGVNVCIVSRSSEKLKKASEEIVSESNSKIIFFAADVSDENQVTAAVNFARKNFGYLDILVNNQGGPLPGAFAAINLSQVQDAIKTNLIPFVHATKLCIDEMKERKWGRIINILSVSAKEPIPNLFLSNLLRPAILGMSKTIAQEYAQYGVTINSVLPSAVLTDRTKFFVNEKSKKENKTFEEALKETAAGLPSKYIATPDEFAQIVLFLCSEKASYVNGTAIPVDGASSKSLY